MILNLGKGTQLSKLDLQNAYTMVPVHLEDQPLLGIRWRGAVYLDTALPFGLRSVPKIFSAVVDTERGELHLPANKLIRLQQTIRYWVSKRSCTKRELVSLIHSSVARIVTTIVDLMGTAHSGECDSLVC